MQSQSDKHDYILVTQSKVKQSKYKRSQKSKGFCLIALGGVVIILALSLIVLQGTIMSFTAEKLLDLRSDSSIFKLWQKYPLNISTAFTFFNWTNHQDFFNKSVKPKFEEIGPYTYLQEIERIDIVRNANNNTITFKQLRNYYFDNNLSNNGNTSDRLTTINYFNMFIAHFIKHWNGALKDVFSEYVSSLDPYYHFDTVIEDEILKGNNNLFIELANYFDFIFPDFPRMDGFAWGKFRNGNPNFEGVYNIANGINRQFDVLNWNYRSTTPNFNGSCSKVQGSLGDVYSYPLNKEFITVFAAEICRYIKFYFEEEVIIDGVLGYKYSVTNLTLDNGTLNAENKCFCEEPCVPSGVLGISSCQFNLNAYFSLPHFYNADPVYINSFEGLNPEKQKHEAYIVVEPNSLLCIEFKIASQANLFIYPVEGISVFDDFPKLYFPLFWMNCHEKLPENLKIYLNMYLTVPYVITITAIILIILGVSGICYGVFKFNHVVHEKAQILD